jgi:hypothetical protein
MKTISVAVSQEEYDTFRVASKRERRPIAQLIREAMSFYREHKLEARSRLTDVPILPGHRLTAPLPERGEVWDEAFDPEGMGR